MQILKILMKALSRKKQQQNTITLFRESINVNNPIHFQTFFNLPIGSQQPRWA